MTAGLAQANYIPLSPLSFLIRSARFLENRVAVIDGKQQFTYGELYSRVQKLASALKSAGIGAGDMVAVLAPNIAPMLETHYAVPWLGAVLNPLNTKLDAAAIGSSLCQAEVRLLILIGERVQVRVWADQVEIYYGGRSHPRLRGEGKHRIVTLRGDKTSVSKHYENASSIRWWNPGKWRWRRWTWASTTRCWRAGRSSRVPYPAASTGLFFQRLRRISKLPWEKTLTALDRSRLPQSELLDQARQALDGAGRSIPIVVINDPRAGLSSKEGAVDYESFIESAPSAAVNMEIEDENQPLSLLYTSGTTTIPKGVVHSHRGAYLASLSNALGFGLNHNSVFLWTWPMFHSNGLSFVWAITAVGGVHVCLREVASSKILDLIETHRVSHFFVAPTLMSALAQAPGTEGLSFEHSVTCAVGGAAPPSSVIRAMEKLGIEVTHQYGSTECYGPATISWRRPEWNKMTGTERYLRLSRQGMPTLVSDLMVANSESMLPVNRDGQSLGEVMLRGNAIMQGYFGNEKATDDAMAGGWFRTGDVAVWHPDGSIEIKDRSVDLIVSRDGIISSVEIEEVLYHHSAVHEVAVVSKPDEILGEVPCAFVTVLSGKTVNAEELATYGRSNLADFKVPTSFVFGKLPKTATGKIKKSELRETAKRLDSPGKV